MDKMVVLVQKSYTDLYIVKWNKHNVYNEAEEATFYMRCHHVFELDADFQIYHAKHSYSKQYTMVIIRLDK